MEDYKKKYEEALERAKGLHEQGMMPERIEYIFPELKESEDERIRKEIIQFLQLPHPQFIGKRNHEKWISWLEKQDEQKPAWSEEDEKIYNLLYEEYKNIAYYSHSREKAEDIPGEVLGWLKSIKERMKENRV